MNFSPIILAVMGLLTAIATGAGTGAVVRVFAVERRAVNKDEMEGYRAENRKLRIDLDAEIKARQRDREYYEQRLTDQEGDYVNRITTLNSNWDACRSECQRLRQLVEDR